MRPGYRSAVMITMTAVISCLVVSCGENKVAQCHKVIKVVNQVAKESNTLTKGGKTSSPDVLLKTAKAMDEAAQQMQAVKVSDGKLQKFQTGFVKMYQDTSQILRDYVFTSSKQDYQGVDRAVQALNKKAIQPSEDLVKDINQYCKS